MMLTAPFAELWGANRESLMRFCVKAGMSSNCASGSLVKFARIRVESELGPIQQLITAARAGLIALHRAALVDFAGGPKGKRRWTTAIHVRARRPLSRSQHVRSNQRPRWSGLGVVPKAVLNTLPARSLFCSNSHNLAY
jgi:hypothetical protein